MKVAETADRINSTASEGPRGDGVQSPTTTGENKGYEHWQAPDDRWFRQYPDGTRVYVDHWTTDNPTADQSDSFAKWNQPGPQPEPDVLVDQSDTHPPSGNAVSADPCDRPVGLLREVEPARPPARA
jgi:hypothetical protein